jgi:hypothetical protein
LQSFAHLLKLHSSSVPSKPDRDHLRVVPSADSEFFPRLAPLCLDCSDGLFPLTSPSVIRSSIAYGLLGEQPLPARNYRTILRSFDPHSVPAPDYASG